MKIYPEQIGNQAADKVDYEIFSHAWSARVQIHLPHHEAAAVLRKLSWRETHPGWRKSMPSGGRRWDLKSSAWLTGRRPSPSSGMGHRNSEWGTILYNLSVQQKPDCYFVNLGGVRRSDLDHLMNKVLGLDPDQWSVTAWQTFERYIVLTTDDAVRLSEALGGRRERRKGREAAKEYLVRGHMVPVTVRTRTRLDAEVVLYRVAPERGTTHAWKLEARLKGRSASGTTFTEEAAIKALDNILLDLVTQHGLKPIVKPARWEPRDRCQVVETADRLPDLKGLRSSAYRGRKPAESEINTPWPFVHVFSPSSVRSSCSDPVISDDIQSHHQNQSNPCFTSSSDDDGWKTKVLQPWNKLSEEILSLPGGNLIEVILPPFQSAGPFIRTLASRPGVRMAASLLTTRPHMENISGVRLTGFELGEILCDHPMSVVDPTHWILIVDSDVVLGVRDALNGRPPAAGVSEHLAHACRGWRQLVEGSGMNIVLVTYDARPVRGRNSWQPSHNFRDTRVRSLLGDAGRYYTHMRYLFEGYEIEGPKWVVVLKDGVDGLGAGRIVWSRPGGNFGKRGRLVELDDLDELENNSILADRLPIMMSQSQDDILDEILGTPEAED